MAIEAVALAATQEVAASAANMEAARQLAEKVAMQTSESVALTQDMTTVKNSADVDKFQVGELTSKEFDAKDVLKQNETNAINELSDKLNNGSFEDEGMSEYELGSENDISKQSNSQEGSDLNNKNDMLETKETYRDTGENCLSTYEERVQQTPREGWGGERGESVCTKETESLGTVQVKYENGIPDFSPYSIADVDIPNMSSERLGEGNNFEQADNALAEQWNKAGKEGRTDWTGAEVRDWRRENYGDYTWHECTDRKHMQLIPREINGTFSHFGGVGECNKLASLNATHYEYDNPFAGIDLLGLFDN